MTSSEWQRQFEAFRRFKRRFGHCRVPRHWPEDPGLARWSATQRQLGGLTFDQVESLYSLGFDFGRGVNQWLDSFFALVLYREKHGHCRRLKRRNADRETRRLSHWVQHQKRMRDRLSLEQKRLLNHIDFEWNPVESLWQRRYGELRLFKQRHGHCNVPDKWPFNPSLGSWACTQRMQCSRKTLSPERRRLLDMLDFDWDPVESSWWRQYRELKKFKTQFGHCNVPEEWSANPALARWVMHQRQLRGKSRTPPEKRAALRAIGFDWCPRQTHWEARYAQLRHFRDRHGHCLVPKCGGHAPLHCWVKIQRKSRGRLTPDQVRRLDAIGFEWTPKTYRTRLWEQRFAETKAFIRKHGVKSLPRMFSLKPITAKWLWLQRRQVKKLSPWQRELLSQIGVPAWKRVYPTFEYHLEQLRRFKREHGHCNVSIRDDRPLAGWLGAQRRLRESLPSPRRRALERLGVDWSPLESDWQTRYRALSNFRHRHGHCHIRLGNTPDRNLLYWVDTQRTISRLGKLRADRRRRLERLGFVWDSEEASWDDRIAKLLAFRKRFGNFEIPYRLREYSPIRQWAWKQRRRLAQGALPPKLKAKLDAIGFA